MFRRFRHAQKHKISAEGEAILQAAVEEETAIRKAEEAVRKAEEAARRITEAEERARKKAAEDDEVHQKISDLQEKVAEFEASAEKLNLLYDESIKNALDAKSHGKLSEARKLLLTAHRYKKQFENNTNREIAYLSEVSTMTDFLHRREHVHDMGRFAAVLKSARESKSFYSNEHFLGLTKDTNGPRDGLVQLLRDKEARIQKGLEEVESLLNIKAVLSRRGSTRMKDTSHLEMVRIIKGDIDKVKMSVSSLIQQKHELHKILDQKEMITCLRLFVDNAQSAIGILRSAPNSPDDSLQCTETAISGEEAADFYGDISKLQTCLSMVLRGTQHFLDTIMDHQRRLYTDSMKLLVQAREEEVQGQVERLHLTLMCVNAAKTRLEALKKQRTFLEKQNASVDMVCVLLEVFCGRHDMQLILDMTSTSCSKANETGSPHGGAEEQEQERLMIAISTNKRKITELSQAVVELQMKRTGLLAEALPIAEENDSLTHAIALQNVGTAGLYEKQKRLRTEQYVRILSEWCCLEQQLEETCVARMFHKLRTEANKLSANDASGNADGAVKQVEGIETVHTIANKIIEDEIARLATTKTKQDLEYTRSRMYKIMLRKPRFGGMVYASHLTMLSKKVAWYSSTMKRVEDYIDDFDQWIFQIWSHAVTEEFHLWVMNFEKESNGPKGDLVQMPDRWESELQSRLGSKLSSIRGSQLKLKEDLESINKKERNYPNLCFLWAERRKRWAVKLSILAAQHSMLSYMLLKREGPIQVLFRGHVRQSPIVKPDEFIAALEDSSSLTFQEVISAHRLMSFLNHKGAVFSPPFDRADARRMFLMKKLYGSLVDLTLTEGQSVFVGDMLHIAQKNGILSEDNVTALFLTLRLKTNVDRRFVQLADVIGDIYHDVAGRISFVATQLASVETALYRMKIAQDRGKKIALWAGLVKFGLSMIPIAGQVAAAGLDMAVQSTEVISELFLSESSVELSGAFLDFVSSAGQYAVDAYVIESGSKLPKSVEENIAAAKLGRMCISAEFRDRLPLAYRERLVKAAEISWGASIEEVESGIDKIVECFKGETEIRVFEIDEDDLHGADVMTEVMRIEETKLLGTSADVSAEVVSNDEGEDSSGEEDRSADGDREESLIERIRAPVREDAGEVEQVEQTLQAIRSLLAMRSTKEEDTQAETKVMLEGRVREDTEIVGDSEEGLPQREQQQLDRDSQVVTADSIAEVDVASEKRIAEGQSRSTLLQETGRNGENREDLSTTIKITASTSDWKDAFESALQQSETVESGKLFHDDAVKCACTVLHDDVDWLPMGYVEDAFLDTDTDGSFRVDQKQFLGAVGKIVGEIETERRAALSTHWAQRFLYVAPPKTGLINTRLAKYLLRNLGVDTEGLGEEVDTIVQKFAVDRKVNLARFARIWRSLSPTTALGHDT